MVNTRRLKLIAVSIPFVMLTACEFDNTPASPTRTEEVHLDRGNVSRANIELDMGAGEMTLTGGADKLIQGNFEFNVPSWEPKVQDSVNGTHAVITIKQPEHAHFGGNNHYRWNLQLNDQVITDLNLNCGAGQARLSLGDLDLRQLDVHMGAGQVDLDLRGTPKRDYDVNISGGVGQATVHLPQNVGIWAEAHGGIGSITVTGLNKEDNHWQNQLYDNAKTNVHLKVEGGIGEIRIIG